MITANFKMGSIDRLNDDLKESRDQYGERQGYVDALDERKEE